MAQKSKHKSKAVDSIVERRKNLGGNLNFAASEAYKLLRTNLIFSMSDESECKIIGITSALRSEGKSTTSLNLAYTMAQTEKKVLLIEADMRIPVMSRLLKINGTPGLSHVLAGVSSLNDAVKKIDLAPNLYTVFAGTIPPNPAELLCSNKMKTIVATLSKTFDYIIIDLPPINAVSDGLAVSKLLSGMVVVVRQDYCDQYALAEAMRQLEFLNVKVLGFVYNDAKVSNGRYKKYSKKYGKYNSKYYE